MILATDQIIPYNTTIIKISRKIIRRIIIMSKRTMGLLISHKNNEKRRAILPDQVAELRNPDMLYFETGYGTSVGHSDEDYINAGANVVSREEAMRCDIITDVKLGDADYLDELEDDKILF